MWVCGVWVCGVWKCGEVWVCGGVWGYVECEDFDDMVCVTGSGEVQPATTNTCPLQIPLQSSISLITGSILFILCPNCDIMNCPKIFRKSLTLYCQKENLKTYLNDKIASQNGVYLLWRVYMERHLCV